MEEVHAGYGDKKHEEEEEEKGDAESLWRDTEKWVFARVVPDPAVSVRKGESKDSSPGLYRFRWETQRSYGEMQKSYGQKSKKNGKIQRKYGKTQTNYSLPKIRRAVYHLAIWNTGDAEPGCIVAVTDDAICSREMLNARNRRTKRPSKIKPHFQ